MKNKLEKIIIFVITIFIITSTICYAETRNNNPLLKQLTINEIELKEFDQFTTEYVIATEKEEINIKAEPEDKNATVEIIGNKKLKPGRNEIEIKVTAEDKKSVQSYYIHITRGNIAKSNANLKEIEIENLELNPHFNVNEINYYVEYKGNLQEIKINAVPESENAKVNISKDINEERLIFKIEVLAEDKITNKIYTVTVIKKEDDTNTDEKQELNELKNEKNQEEIKDLDHKEEINDNNKEDIQNDKKTKYYIVVIMFFIILIFIFLAKKIKG